MSCLSATSEKAQSIRDSNRRLRFWDNEWSKTTRPSSVMRLLPSSTSSSNDLLFSNHEDKEVIKTSETPTRLTLRVSRREGCMASTTAHTPASMALFPSKLRERRALLFRRAGAKRSRPSALIALRAQFKAVREGTACRREPNATQQSLLPLFSAILRDLREVLVSNPVNKATRASGPIWLRERSRLIKLLLIANAATKGSSSSMLES